MSLSGDINRLRKETKGKNVPKSGPSSSLNMRRGDRDGGSFIKIGKTKKAPLKTRSCVKIINPTASGDLPLVDYPSDTDDENTVFGCLLNEPNNVGDLCQVELGGRSVLRIKSKVGSPISVGQKLFPYIGSNVSDLGTVGVSDISDVLDVAVTRSLEKETATTKLVRGFFLNSLTKAIPPTPVTETIVKLSIGSCEAFEIEPYSYYAWWSGRITLSEAFTGNTALAFLGTRFEGKGAYAGSLYILLDCPDLEYDPMIAGWEPNHSYTTGDKVQPNWNLVYGYNPDWPGYMEATCDFVSGAQEPGVAPYTLWNLADGGYTDDDVTPNAWLTHSGGTGAYEHLVTTLIAGPVAGPTITWDTITTYRWKLVSGGSGVGITASPPAPIWFGNPDA